ncbi:MAG: glycosyltransferase family 2 protein [Bryobacteraceae bacterium]
MDFRRAEKAFSARDARELWKALAALAENQRNTPWTRQLARYAVSDAAPPPAVTGPDQLFLDSIVETKRVLQGASPRVLKRRFIGPEMDFLAEKDGIGPWSIPQCLNYLLLSHIRPHRRSAVVGTMRDDGIYIMEWVAHYLALGFDHVIIYTNNNSDGSEELLRLLAEHGIITLIEDAASETVPPDDKANGHAVHLLPELRDFEWAMFVDSDEYFVPGPQYNQSVVNILDAVQQRFPDKPPSGICYHWLWFVSGMAYARKPQPLLERFQHARPHHLTKCIARIPDLLSMRLNHAPWVKPGGTLIDSVFDPIDLDASCSDAWWEAVDAWRTPRYGGGRVNHYWARSFEEFAVKKARGASLKMEQNMFDRPYASFFQWNGFETPENYYPVDPILLANVKRKIKELETLEGVRSVASKISRNFPRFLKRIHTGAELRKIYEESMTSPADL